MSDDEQELPQIEGMPPIVVAWLIRAGIDPRKLMRQPRQRMVTKTMERVIADWLQNYEITDEVGYSAVVRNRVACCGSGRRDGLGVAGLTPKRSIQKATEQGGSSDFRGVVVGLFDDHYARAVEALIDVEDAKTFLNHLSAAIAAAEADRRTKVPDIFNWED